MHRHTARDVGRQEPRAVPSEQPTTSVRRPRYPREAVRVGIAHLGLGNFARAHLARYADDMLELHPDEPWGIVGIGVRTGEAATRKAAELIAHDCVCTLLEADEAGERACRLLGSVRAYLHFGSDPDKALEVLASPAIDLVTLTITEGGYGIREDTREYDLEAWPIARELAAPDTPGTAVGILVEAMRRRRSAGDPPPVVVSCDNLRSNGATTRNAVVSHAAALDPALAAWIDRYSAFPNSMVDCIVPATTAELVAEVGATWRVDDPQTVLCERFKQWIIERPVGRLARLTEVGAEAVDDVAPYESAKARMINASHVVLGHLGLLLGHRFVHEAVADEDLAALVRSFMREDVFPYLEPPAGLDAQEYHEAAMARFSNRAIPDELRRLAFDGAAKLPTYISDIARLLVGSGASVERVALLVAAHRAYTRRAVTSGELSRRDLEPSISDSDWERLVCDSPDGLVGCEYLSRFGIESHPTFPTCIEAACLAVDADARAAVVAAT